MDPIKTIKDISSFYKKLPSVGGRTALRLAYATVFLPKEDLIKFSEILKNAVTQVKECPKCGLLIDSDKCPICSDSSRDQATILVVTDVKNVIAIENTETYKGLYFVLKGSLAPSEHRTPESIGLFKLRDRVLNEKIKEVIVCTDSDLEGETTALYIASLLKNVGCKVTKLASGLPSGAILEYADPLTISQAIKGRVSMEEKKED